MVRKASNPEIRIILTKARSAGWRVEDASSGWKVKSPDGQSIVTIHGSSSDRRALAAIKSDFKRAGLDLDAPIEKKPQPTLANEHLGLAHNILEEKMTDDEEEILALTGLPENFKPVDFNPPAQVPPGMGVRPKFLPPQPLVPAKQPAPSSSIVWETPPPSNRRNKTGRAGPMDKYRAAMVQRPGEWLVFVDETGAGTKAYYKRLYESRGFEFESRTLAPEKPGKFKVYARYVGTTKEEA
jgi:hypothetical protein